MKFKIVIGEEPHAVHFIVSDAASAFRRVVALTALRHRVRILDANGVEIDAHALGLSLAALKQAERGRDRKRGARRLKHRVRASS